MKRLLILLLVLTMLTGCRSLPAQTPETPAEPGAPTTVTRPEQETDLMPGASPQTSALALYRYDGNEVSRLFLFDTQQVEEILRAFHEAKVQPVDLNVTELKAPYYGLEIGGEDGFTVCGLWSEGYFITDTGSAYAFSYDFQALEQSYAWSSADTFDDPAVMPCANYAARSENGWNTAFLKPAEEPAGPKGISMELVSASAEQVVVRYVNQTLSEWSYGLFAELHALSDGVWYNLPAGKDYAVISIAKLVPAGKSLEQEYGLVPYWELFPGTYRLVSNGLFVEFTVK